MNPSIAGHARDTTGYAHEARDLDAHADHLSDAALRPLLDRAWTRSGGQDQLPTERWTALWRRCGFMYDGQPVPRPAEPVRLYRGGREGEGRMSWTTSREVAGRYAASAAEHGARRPVWMTLAPPESLLSQRTGDGEFVVDPALVGPIEVDRADPFHEMGAAEVRGFRLTWGSAPSNLDRVFAGQRTQRRAVTTDPNPMPWMRPRAPRRPSWRDW